MPPTLHPLHAQVSSALHSRHHIPVDPRWLNDFLTSRGPNPPPVAALISTAHFRILASDITTSISTATTAAAPTFPEDASDVTVHERRLEGHVIVQVLDVHDVGASKFSQIEAIERVERGEEIRGREVIRSVRVESGHDGDDEGAATSTTSTNNAVATTTGATSTSSTSTKLTSGPHKLVVQDAKGTRMFALEVEKVPKLGVSVSAGARVPTGTSGSGAVIGADDPGMFIGCKLLLRPGTVVRRGIIMLTPGNCVVMGGKVEAWDKQWREGRKGRLVALMAEGGSSSNSSSNANPNVNGTDVGG
ncbi:hypothetical protein A1O7_04231 [Cladophialophora yegresii CBS 114405]|uniref:RecQ-mediated genome instability protein 1 n=1 Tax=Cladophialophora yegresii CBS 114405 TaxID=1182544 RepID=W9W6C9_9EURO|nr:uncharacterized protein A1O7_04231 [Cladophialophora yegresii CBS 114405]EXJ60081.1 hypothetical protein A1O7_04231 [Cladophialophora yegresii CBS 114405]